MKRKSLKELKELILNDMKYSENFIEDEYIIKDQNPQVVEMKIKERARIEAMEDVLRYIENGEKYGFRKE